MRILIANEPDMYREVIFAVLDELTPDIEIFASDPDDLEGEFLRVQHHLVVCSRATKTWSVRRPCGSSSTPVGTSHAVVKKCLDGSRRILPGMDFDTFVSILDGI